MSDDGQTVAQRSANLARIRDNQRRSRARRKEYLQELETKYRTCEQSGVEASAEIQAAARRVVDENRKLRQLLKQQGLSDAEIDGFIADRPENPQYPTAAKALEEMIGQRRPCASGGSCGSEHESTRRRSVAAPASQPMHIPQQDPQQQTQYLGPLQPSPHSNASSGVPTPNTAHFQASQAQQYPEVSAPHQSSVHYSMSWDDPLMWQDQYQPNQHQMNQQVATGDSSSCYVAADAIRVIKPDIGYELETELGCGNGGECHVPNTQIFSIMDRYGG